MQYVTKQSAEQITPNQPEPELQFSLRLVGGLEIASVIASVFITTWVIIPLQPEPRWLMALPGFLAALLMLYSHRLRGEKLSEIGFSLRNFWKALSLVAVPTLAVCSVITMIGFLTNSFHLTSHFWTNLLVLPVWAVIQQYVLQAFIYRRMRWIFISESDSPEQSLRQTRLAILATAVIFSVTHLPNLMLMLLTLLGALLWSWVYERAPNLFALGLSHATISLMLMTSLPPWFLPSMSVGYKHFLYQVF
ncbi:MAG: CPBP family intramembrane metalloprotease [Acidobacteria bacterium]|nr:CPBP family intramembrane metalloprotease [Acidobacteriota bacterium]